MILVESAVDSQSEELRVILIDDDDTNAPRFAHIGDLFCVSIAIAENSTAVLSINTGMAFS
jgi:hypothetical protein